jgi:hypothetical protein
VLGIRHRDHDRYVFHMSMAYMIRHPSEAERGRLVSRLADELPRLPSRFTLGAPEYCHFDDMFAFERQFFLSGTSQRGSTPANSATSGTTG